MRSPRRVLLLAALTCGVLTLGAGPSTAQAEPSLVIVRPAQGSTSDPDVLILVELRGAGGSTPVRFTATLDGTPVRLEDAATGRFMAQATASAGRQTKVYVRSIPEGRHTLQVIPAAADQARPSSVVTFQVDAGRTSTILVIAAVLVILVLFVFRRRILTPMGDRYERPRPPEPEPDEG